MRSVVRARHWILAMMVVLLAGCVTEVVGAKKNVGPIPPVTVGNEGWVRWMPPQAKVTAAYIVINNPTLEPDELLAVSSPRARVVEIHRTLQSGNAKSMQRIRSLPIDPANRVEFMPGGYHLMLIDLTAPLSEGEQIPVSLEFRRSGKIDIELPVYMMMGNEQGSASGESR